MKELQYLKVINEKLSDNSLLGDDCAFLKEFGLFVTQDTLVEDVHFKLDWITPRQLAKKAVTANLSDLAASACNPKYITISISAPSYINDTFISKFYEGVEECCQNDSIRVAGGDITGANKLCISICAIGEKVSGNVTSRSFAKPNDIIVATGFFGSSAAGLYMLQNKIQEPNKFIIKHLEPTSRVKETLELAALSDNNFACMDTSDGLVDALFKIAQASSVTMNIEFENIPVDTELEKNFKDYKSLVLSGGEDYEIIACVNENTYQKLDKSKFQKIGFVSEKIDNTNVIIKNKHEIIKIDQANFEDFTYDHFKENS